MSLLLIGKKLSLHRIKSTITIFANNHRDILETESTQVASIILLDINLGSSYVSLNLIDNRTKKAKSTECNLGSNQLLVIPYSHKLVFNPPFTGQYCIALTFFWTL